MPQTLAEASDARQAIKAAEAALAQVLRDREALFDQLDRDIANLIEQALARIVGQLAAAPTDYQLWVLPRLIEGIRRVIDELATGAGARASEGLQRAWSLGELTVDAPLNAVPSTVGPATAAPAAALSQPDLRQLRAMQAFTTQLIGGAAGDTVKAINRALGQVVLGASTPAEAIRAVAKLLPQRTRTDIRTIVNSNLAQAANTAAFERLQQRAQLDPNVRKQWRRSRKLHSRANHDMAHGQAQEVGKPFTLRAANGKGTVDLMYPCDPKAPLGEILNCGCTVVPWRDGWTLAGRYAKPPAEKPAQAKRPATAEQSSGVGRKTGGMTTQARILGAFAQAPTFRDVTGQRLVVDARLAPAGIGDARLTKAGTDLYSYHAVQTLRRPTEVWQAEHVDTSSGEIVRTRVFLKRFRAAGRDWLGRAEFRREGDLWVPAGAYRAEPLAAGTGDQALAAARAGARVWPKRR